MCAHRLTPCTPRASMELDYESFDAPPVANPQSDRPMLRHRLSRLPGHLAEILEDDNEALIQREGDEGLHEVTKVGTKVVATIGPACQSVDTLAAMIRAGMSCARIDLSNGDTEYHLRSLRNVAEACRLEKKMIAIMVDTIGPEMFVDSGTPSSYKEGWPAWGHACEVEIGQRVILNSGSDTVFSNTNWPVSYPKFAELCKVGQMISVGRYLATGMEGMSVTLEVVGIKSEHEVECVAKNSAKLCGLITMFIQDLSPDSSEASQFTVDLPVLSARDVDLITALGQVKFQASDCIDFISLSYCNTAEHVKQARAFLDEIGLKNTNIVAKVETKKGLCNFESIVKEADGVIISRGNLGIDIPVEKFPILMKALVHTCNSFGKPVLTTRVFDSMMVNPRPTRAEATDISNMIIDGVDGIVLGAETLRGMFPVIAVKTVLSCANEATKCFDNSENFKWVMKWNPMLSNLESMASSAVRVADKIKASVIVVVTGTGRTARIVCKYRPDVPVIALVVPKVSRDKANRWQFSGRHAARQSMIVRGLFPMLAVGSGDEGSILEDAVTRAIGLGIAKPHDHIVCLFNPHGSNVPVIKLVSVDSGGRKIAERTTSMASNMNTIASGVNTSGSLASLKSSDSDAPDLP